jgi:hypothetical protein
MVAADEREHLASGQPLERLRDDVGQTQPSNPSSPETLTVARAGRGP